MKFTIENFGITLSIPNNYNLVKREDVNPEQNLSPFLFACVGANRMITATATPQVKNLSPQQTVQKNLNNLTKFNENKLEIKFLVDDIENNVIEVIIEQNNDIIIQIYYFFESIIICLTGNAPKTGVVSEESYIDYAVYDDMYKIIKTITIND